MIEGNSRLVTTDTAMTGAAATVEPKTEGGLRGKITSLGLGRKMRLLGAGAGIIAVTGAAAALAPQGVGETSGKTAPTLTQYVDNPLRNERIGTLLKDFTNQAISDLHGQAGVLHSSLGTIRADCPPDSASDGKPIQEWKFQPRPGKWCYFDHEPTLPGYQKGSNEIQAWGEEYKIGPDGKLDNTAAVIGLVVIPNNDEAVAFYSVPSLLGKQFPVPWTVDAATRPYQPTRTPTTLEQAKKADAEATAVVEDLLSPVCITRPA